MSDQHKHASTPSPVDGVDPSVAADPVPAHRIDPRPDTVVTELDRIVRRFRELPEERAESAEPLVRSALGELLPPAMPSPPALGVATTIEQLRVLTFDTCLRARTSDSSMGLAAVADVLTRLRRALP